MTIDGRLLELQKRFYNSQGRINPQNSESVLSNIDSSLKNAIIIIEAINDTGATIEPYTCVVLASNTSALDLPKFKYPESTDNTELKIYGSLLDQTLNGEVGHVQISGLAFLRILDGSDDINIGEIVYPLANVTNKKGKVGNLASSDSSLISSCPIGRALADQASDSIILPIILSGPGATKDLNTTYAARGADTSRTSTPDGLTLSSGEILLVVSGANKGVWKYNGGSSYTSLGLYKAVAVREGTTYGRRLMVYSEITGTYVKNYAVFSA